MQEENSKTRAVKITPAMREAGAHAFCSFDERFEDIGDVVDRIWAAMEKARISEQT